MENWKRFSERKKIPFFLVLLVSPVAVAFSGLTSFQEFGGARQDKCLIVQLVGPGGIPVVGAKVMAIVSDSTEFLSFFERGVEYPRTGKDGTVKLKIGDLPKSMMNKSGKVRWVKVYVGGVPSGMVTPRPRLVPYSDIEKETRVRIRCFRGSWVSVPKMKRQEEKDGGLSVWMYRVGATNSPEIEKALEEEKVSEIHGASGYEGDEALVLKEADGCAYKRGEFYVFGPLAPGAWRVVCGEAGMLEYLWLGKDGRIRGLKENKGRDGKWIHPGQGIMMGPLLRLSGGERIKLKKSNFKAGGGLLCFGAFDWRGRKLGPRSTLTFHLKLDFLGRLGINSGKEGIFFLLTLSEGDVRGMSYLPSWEGLVPGVYRLEASLLKPGFESGEPFEVFEKKEFWVRMGDGLRVARFYLPPIPGLSNLNIKLFIQTSKGAVPASLKDRFLQCFAIPLVQGKCVKRLAAFFRNDPEEGPGFDNLWPGEWEILAARLNNVVSSVIKIGEKRDESLKLVIPDGSEVFGVVVGKRGIPQAGLRLILKFAGSHGGPGFKITQPNDLVEPLSVISSPKGTFRFSGVGPGTWRIEIRDKDGRILGYKEIRLQVGRRESKYLQISVPEK